MRSYYSVSLYHTIKITQMRTSQIKFSNLEECKHMHVCKRKFNILHFFFFHITNCHFYSTHHIRNQQKTCFFFLYLIVCRLVIKTFAFIYMYSVFNKIRQMFYMFYIEDLLLFLFMISHILCTS